MNPAFDFLDQIPLATTPKRDITKKPDAEAQLHALGVGQIDPNLFVQLVHLRQTTKAPGAPIKNEAGSYMAGPVVDWFPSRGTGKEKVMLVGLYPADEEYRQKKVMVGPSGRELTNALAALGIKADDCILTNVIRYPYLNKTQPPPLAYKHGLPYLEAEIAHFKPDLVLCLGGNALSSLLGLDIKLDDYRGTRFRVAGRPYDIAVVWQPAFVLRERNLYNTWLDDLALVFNKKERPAGATDYQAQDKLPSIDVYHLAELQKQVREMVQAGETEFTIDTEFYGDSPKHSLLLNFQLASNSRSLNLVLHEGNWRPKVFLRNHHGADAVMTDKTHTLQRLVNDGYVKTSQNTGMPLAQLLSLTLENDTQWQQLRRDNHQQRVAATGENAAKLWWDRMEKEENLAMRDGNIMVFQNEDEQRRYLMENNKLRRNLITYTIGGRYVFDATLSQIGDALRPLFDPNRGDIKLRGHNINVDITRVKSQLGIDLTPFNDVDTMLLAMVLDEGQPRGLEDICRRYLNAPNHKLELLVHMEERGLKGEAYCFVKPSVLNKYSRLDARRNHDVVTPMLQALLAETSRVWRLRKVSNVPRVKPGDSTRGQTLCDEHLEVNHWPNADYLYDAFFNYKMPQSRALTQPMDVGQPINAPKMKELIDWYDQALKQQIKHCQETARPFWNPNGNGRDFEPNSSDQTALLLFKIKGLMPIKATDKTDKDWNARKHAQWLDDLANKRKPKSKPSTDSESLEILAEQDPLAKTINDTRFIATIVKNYMRKGGRWADRSTGVAAGATRGIEEVDTTNFQLLREDQISDYVDQMEEAMASEQEETRKRWDEREKDQTSKAISLVVAPDDRLYSCYYATLESHRLATKPNVSAIVRGETRYIKDILGKMPPSEIRQLNEAPQDWFIISADWKSAEVWMIAILSWLRSKMRGHEMDNLLKIISDPKRCVHASTARKMFPDILANLTDSEIKEQYPHLRELAKPVVFGIPYGRGPGAIAQQLNRNAINNYLEKLAKGEPAERPKEVTKDEARSFVDAYFEMAPECWDFLNEQKSLVTSPGFQINPWGLVRRFPKTDKEDEIADQEREASNWQIQGGVALACAQACNLWRTNYQLKYPKLPMYLIDILHDAFKWLIHKSMLPYYEEIVDSVMGKGLKLPFEHPIPMGFDISFYKAYERKEFDGKIQLEDPADPKKHAKTFLGKYGDTPENRAFYARHGKKSDFIRFTMKYGATEADHERKGPLELAL